MLLAQISTWIYQAVRGKLHPDQIVLLMDSAQRMGFDNDMKAFLIWTETLTIEHELAFSLTLGYTNAIDTDIGKTVEGITSGANAILISFDNAARIWLVEMASGSADFLEGEAITITTGTGLGFLAAEDSFLTHMGPYSAPLDPPCRKIWGVTTMTEAQIFGPQNPTIFPMNDFDFLPACPSPAAFFKPGRENNVEKTFTFSQRPAASAIYRWVYWRDPPAITGIDDETQLAIPATYHLNLINAAIKLAQMNIAAEDVDPKVIQSFFAPWWATLARPYTPMGKATNQTLNPRGRSDSLL